MMIVIHRLCCSGIESGPSSKGGPRGGLEGGGTTDIVSVCFRCLCLCVGMCVSCVQMSARECLAKTLNSGSQSFTLFVQQELEDNAGKAKLKAQEMAYRARENPAKFVKEVWKRSCISLYYLHNKFNPLLISYSLQSH